MKDFGRFALAWVCLGAPLAACSSGNSATSGAEGDASANPAGSDAATAPDATSGGASDGGADASVPSDATTPLDAAASDASPDASPPDAAPDPSIEDMHTRADDALSTFMLTFWPQLAANTTTYDWMYAHYWDAVLDATERRGPNAFSGTAKMFFELQAKRGWLDGFYDDENWITLALLHAYRVTGDATYLNQAKTVYADIMNAWDTTCCGAHLGGMWWEKPTTSKVTAINAGAVVSAARLYAATKDSTYLSFGQKVYDFWSTNMVDKTTGHVDDGEDNSGNVNTTWSFTYNEGLFIGAIVEMARVTGDTSQIALAHTVAGYMMKVEKETTDAGTILSDGKCSGDGEMFKGIGARYLGELYAMDTSHSEYRDFLHRSGDAAWTLARDPASGKISCDWQGPYDGTTGVAGSLGSAAIGLAAAAQALGPGKQRPALVYEAEEGDLHAVGLEANYAGFSGWGYLAGWGGDGESVDLLVKVPTAGTYAIDLRYATGDNANRMLTVNGQAGANVAFPNTGGYATYQSVTTTATLPAGDSTLTIAYVSGQGSGGYLNLDKVTLTAK